MLGFSWVPSCSLGDANKAGREVFMRRQIGSGEGPASQKSLSVQK
jgi:hypothetical protein